MEAAVLWKAAMRPRLPTGLGKRYAFPTAPTAPASDRETQTKDPKGGSAVLILKINPTGHFTCYKNRTS